MPTDLILAIAHHLAVFTLAGLMLAEWVLLRPGLAGARLRQLGRIDAAYGAVAGLVVVIGIIRVIFGDKGAWFYLQSWTFWAKMGAFVLVGLLTIPATLAILGWRRQAAAEPAFAPDTTAIAALRPYLVAQIAIFVFILIFAAAMARGYGFLG